MAKHGNAENRVISQDSYQALCRLKKLAWQDIYALLSELEAAKSHLGEANWIEVARFWKSHAPANFEEKLVVDVFHENMELFIDRPQKARSGVRSKAKKFVDAFGRSYIGLITAKQAKKHYRQPLTQEEGEAWFEIRPKLVADNAEVS